MILYYSFAKTEENLIVGTQDLSALLLTITGEFTMILRYKVILKKEEENKWVWKISNSMIIQETGSMILAGNDHCL